MNIRRSTGWSLCLVLILIGQNSYSQNPDLVIERVHMEHVYDVIFSPNGNLIASTSSDDNLKLWDAHSFREIRTIAKYCHSIAFTNDGKFILCANGTIQVIDPATGTQTSEIKPVVQVAGEIQVLPGSNSLIATGKDRIVRRLDLATGSEIARFDSSGQGERTAFVVSPDGRLLAVGGGTSTSTIWDITSRTPIKVIPIRVEHGSFSRNNKYLAAPARGQVALWEVGTDNISYPLKYSSYSGERVMFSPVADTLAIGAQGTLRVFDLKTGNIAAQFDVNAGEEVRPTTWDELGNRRSPGFYTIDSLTFSPDGRFVVCGTFPRKRPSPCPLKIYDLKNHLALETTSVRPPQVYSATFSAQGSLLATAAGEHIKLWDLNSGAVSRTLDGYDEINAVAFNPVDNVLVSASDAYRTKQDRIVRWDMGARKKIGAEDFTSLPEAGINPISGTSAHIKSLAISSDGKMLATGSSGHGQLVIIWDAGSGSAKLALKGHDREVSAVAFSGAPVKKLLSGTARDYTILASGSANHDKNAGVVNLWNVSNGESN